MASEPVLSREVGNRTSFHSQPVMVISAMLFVPYNDYPTIANGFFLFSRYRIWQLEYKRIDRSQGHSIKGSKKEESGFGY